MITKETATDIALAYRECETAEKLLADVKDALSRREMPDLRDAFGRPQGGLQLGIPSGESAHRCFNVPYDLVVPVLETHIAHHRARISVLCEKARVELEGAAND